MACKFATRALGAALAMLLSAGVAGAAPAPSTAAPPTASSTTTAPAAAQEALPTGKELMRQAEEMARLSAEIERKQALYAKGPHRKFISASTKQPEFAAYMHAWVDKVEASATRNFPEEVRRRGLAGRVILTVSIARDGRLLDIVLQKSSGERLLDQAARDVVTAAAPFAPLPRTAEDVQILDITRTFNFVAPEPSKNPL